MQETQSIGRQVECSSTSIPIDPPRWTRTFTFTSLPSRSCSSAPAEREADSE